MSEIAILAPMPTISRALGAALDPERRAVRFGPSEAPEERNARIRRNDPAPGMVIRLQPDAPSAAVVAEAKRVLPQLERAMMPPPSGSQTGAALRMLEKLNASVASPVGPDTLRMRACFLAEAGADLPAAAWDQAVDRKLLRAFKFMPSVAEIVEILEAEIQPLRDKIARVRLVSQFERIAADRTERPDPAEIERRKVALAELQSAAEAQANEDREIRDFGMWMPAGAEGKAGLELAGILRSHLATLDGPKLRITLERIEALERNAAILAQLATFEATENRA
ncbi:hypothetical protein [Gluconobacter oxydans]|uniref:Uncharacterized protein n=1 Tax=Gluconobacter oxydans (strain 621H) TaxID=290633 RepID=Q5FN52_GLUOX|nr:hypothetical protein [Gluconobacter oxydans]AAW62195.1 Hypothetical protein GOX2464 [Gluconobacter oxydans 621H]